MRRAFPVAIVSMFIISGTAFLLGMVGGQDEVPPRVMGVRVLNVGEHHFDAVWETDEATKGGVEWGSTTDYGNVTREIGSYRTEHRINVTGLNRSTDYHFRVFAEDLHGNPGYSEDFELATHPLDGEEDGGLPFWAWTVIMIVIVVPFAYFLLGRFRGG